MIDSFDPRTWELEREYEYRVYGDNLAQTWAIVDWEDYQWAVQWCWHINKPHSRRGGSKLYFVRTTGFGGSYKPKLYLHVEIMKRTGIEPPSDLHKLVDHINGNEHDCRRQNLHWTTAKENASNQYIKRRRLYNG